MVIRHLEHIGALRLEPGGLFLSLALGTMPIAARVVGDLLVAARLTSPEVSTERRRATSDEVGEHPSLLKRSCMRGQILVLIPAKDLGHVEPRLFHGFV